MIDTQTKPRLLELIERHFPAWRPSPTARATFDALDVVPAAALYRALLHEELGQPGFTGLPAHADDLHQFDLRLNALLCEILASRTPIESLWEPRESSFFVRDATSERNELPTLLANGYVVSSHRLDSSHLAIIEQEIASCVFVNKGIFTRELTGKQILAGIANGSLTGQPSRNGDTYWLKDQDQLTRRDFFRALAFDPYILSTVARYLGCCPIHVQTNVWFSFPTFTDKWNFSANAQMFHQDKEFTKFIKVFIYLSDVGTENGPHCYIEGSHAVEAHTLGVALSQRIPDAEIGRYYDAGRVRKLTGPAGAITFGDTSCVHKGVPVKECYRGMLQLEYAASLHLTPVCPFSDFPDLARTSLPYPPQVTARLLANYNSRDRASFQSMESATAPPSTPGLVRKLVQLGKRYLPRQQGGNEA